MSKIVLRNQSCECGSKDGRQVYGAGDSFCFSCNSFFPPIKGVDMRNGADTAVTADRVSQHQVNRKSDKDAKKQWNRGLMPWIRSHIDEWFPSVDQEFTAGMIMPLVKEKFPHSDAVSVGGILKVLHDKKVIVRVGGNRSGTYQRVATKTVNVLHVPNPDELGDQLIAAATALIELAKQRNLLAEKARKYDEMMLKLAEFQ